jgi:hypothetical protein
VSWGFSIGFSVGGGLVPLSSAPELAESIDARRSSSRASSRRL